MKHTLILFIAITFKFAIVHAGAVSCISLFEGNKQAQQTWSKDLIPKEQIVHRRIFNGDQGTASLQSGRYKGQSVIVKYRIPYTREAITYDKTELENGGRWLKWLNAQDIGVKFFGFTKVDGRPGMVIERVTESNKILKEPNNIDEVADEVKRLKRSKIVANEQTISELNRAIDTLIANNIIAVDLQFLITTSGKLILIDPDAFRYHRPGDWKNSAEVGESQRQLFLAVLEKLQKND